MTIDEAREALTDIVEVISGLPASEREARFHTEVAKLPRSAQRFVMSVVAARLIIRPDNAAQINVHCEKGGVAQIGAGNMSNTTTNTQNISGSTFNAPVGINQAFSNCYNAAQTAPQADVQELLKGLISEVEKIHPQLDERERSKAERKLKTLTEEAVQPEPDKEQLALSGKGLIEAATTCAAIAPPVISTVKAILTFFGVSIP